MYISKLTLTNYRNHEYASFNFKEGINVFVGENAAGKTNVVEAIDYLSLTHSFRGAEDFELIKKDSKFATGIQSQIVEGEIKRNINVVITENGKKIFINNKPISKLSELAKIVNVILFEPKDVMIFRGAPFERRNFLDLSISKKSESYFDYLVKYEKILKKRNELLKSEIKDEQLLETTTEMLIKMAGPIINFRTIYLKDITDILNKIARVLTGARDKIEIEYKPFVPYDEHFDSNAKEAFKRALESDLKHKATSIGPHREDITVRLNGREIGAFGSQGENRIVAIALKLSPYFLINDRDKKPIVVLDDVMSELDSNHQARLIKFLSKFSQVFITATKLEVNGATHYQIKKNK